MPVGPSWVRTVQLALVAAVMLVAIVVTRDGTTVWPLSCVALAALGWKGRLPPRR